MYVRILTKASRDSLGSCRKVLFGSLHLFKVTSAFMEGKGTLTGTHSAGSGLREKQIQVYLS